MRKLALALVTWPIVVFVGLAHVLGYLLTGIVYLARYGFFTYMALITRDLAEVEVILKERDAMSVGGMMKAWSEMD